MDLKTLEPQHDSKTEKEKETSTPGFEIKGNPEGDFAHCDNRSNIEGFCIQSLQNK
jgi:hypothetical protein